MECFLRYLLMIVLMVAVACSSPPPPVETDAASETAAPQQKYQGAVVIVLDTLRADRLSCYGHSRGTSPRLDSLAEQGVLFRQAVAAAPWTLPSVASLLSADYPRRHLVDGKLSRSWIEPIRDAGFHTAAFTEGGYVSRTFSFDLGFTTFHEEQGAVQLLEAGQESRPQAGGGIENTFKLAMQWLESHADERFFLFIHTYEPHTPYTRHDFTSGMSQGSVGPAFTIPFLDELQSGRVVLTPDEVDYVRALYDGGVLHSDRHVGALVDRLESLGLRDRTLLVVTSDHGEELSDHHPAFIGEHGHCLLDTQLLVPLILVDPLHNHAVHEVAPQVRLMDVLPTVADLLDVPSSGTGEGRSLVPLLSGDETGDRLTCLGFTQMGPPRVGLRAMGYKYIETVGTDSGRFQLQPPPPRVQVYDLGADPGERDNLAESRPKLTAELRELFMKKGQALGQGAPLEGTVPEDEAALERLRSLGYIE